MLNMTKIILALMVWGACSAAFAEEGESIVFNPATGNYLITHYSEFDKKFEQLIFIPATKINPMFQSKFKLEQNGVIKYEYTLINGPDSRQMIRRFILDPVSSVTSSLPDIPLNAPPGKIMADMMNVASHFDTPPAPWRAMMGYSTGEMSFRISLGYRQETGGLAPGSKVALGFKSLDLPSIIQAEIYAYAPSSQEIDGEELPDAEDGGFGQQYFALIRNNFLRRYAAVPTIAVPSPFDAAVTLERIQANTHTWIGMKLLDVTFSSQLDRSLTAAADAYRRNQLKAGKDHIQDVRLLLKKAYTDLENQDIVDEETGNNQGAQFKNGMIARLAARVLDFNVKYVLKQLEK